uniref:Uncharacterized protein n=1 Tax=Alexandrium catenella TaxID=2925 RepID=A0A7S1QDI3_ALECA
MAQDLHVGNVAARPPLRGTVLGDDITAALPASKMDALGSLLAEKVKCCNCRRQDDKVEELAEAITVVPDSYGTLSIDRRRPSIQSLSSSLVEPEKMVEIVRTGPHWRTIGMLIVPSEDEMYLTIQAVVTPSLMSSHNEKAEEGSYKVRKGNRIVAVNTARTVDGMLRLIQASGKGSVLTFQLE